MQTNLPTLYAIPIRIWLSDQEKLERCYEIADQDDYQSIWVRHGASVYRLPAFNEWNAVVGRPPWPNETISLSAWTQENIGADLKQE